MGMCVSKLPKDLISADFGKFVFHPSSTQAGAKSWEAGELLVPKRVVDWRIPFYTPEVFSQRVFTPEQCWERKTRQGFLLGWSIFRGEVLNFGGGNNWWLNHPSAQKNTIHMLRIIGSHITYIFPSFSVKHLNKNISTNMVF